MSKLKRFFIYVVPIALLLRCFGLIFFEWDIEYLQDNLMYVDTHVSGFPLPASASFASHNESGTPLSTNIPLFSVNLVIVFFVAYIIYRRFIGRWWPENKTTGIILSGIIILVYVLSIWFIADYELRRWSSHSVPWPDEWSIVGFHLR